MSYRYVYPNGTPAVNAAPVSGYGVDPGVMSAGYPNAMYDDRYGRRSYSPGSFSSDSASDDYEYRGRLITRETRCPRDVVRAPTPPPIIKRVVERAPTPEAPVMERVIIRPQAQEIVERVIEQPRTPPPRIIEKEMHEEAPPPIVRTRVIKVDRPLRSGYSQPGSPYTPCNGLPSFSNGGVVAAAAAAPNSYRAQSIAGSISRPVAYNVVEANPSFSSVSSFEYPPQASVAAAAPAVAPVSIAAAAAAAPAVQTQQMLMMPTAQQMQPGGILPQQVQPVGVMQQPQQQIMYQPVPVPMSSQMPQFSNNYFPQNYMFQQPQQGMTFGYRPMMQQQQQQQQQLLQGRMIPSGMPMMAATNPLAQQANLYPGQPQMFNPVAQQLVY